VPTFGSLFAGIGGVDLGLERAGWECRWQVEIDPFCRHVLEHHWPDVPRYGDIRELDWNGVERVDLLAGGFPCQPFSTAGQRRRLDDDRWLWPEFARAIRELRPAYVLVENVPGLLVGGGMGSLLGGLAELGYDAEWESIPASAVGAPHLRYRVWIVAYANALADSARAEWRGSQLQVVASRDRAAEPRECYGDSRSEPGRWLAEPGVGRVADGVPSRLDRLRALGNAVVPQVVEVIGRRLLEVERAA
jgi:DNA (cytosine-5)-methyltransferase 1